MEELTICYELNFNVAIRRNNGSQRKNYALLATGVTYTNALWDAYFTLKKRKCTLIKVNSAKVNRIAFAMNEQHNFVKAALADYPLAIPEDLNNELSLLPQK